MDSRSVIEKAQDADLLDNEYFMRMLSQYLAEKGTAPPVVFVWVGRRESGRSRILDLHNHIMPKLEIRSTDSNGQLHATDSNGQLRATEYPEEVD